MRLSLVIPAYNEEERIGETLRDVDAYLARQDYEAEVVVVDDGSGDATASAAQAASPEVRLITYQPNRGKGHAVRTGMRAAAGDYRVFYDADGSTPIHEIERLWPRFEAGADVVIGSRSLPDSDVQVRQHILRQSMGRTFNVFVKLLLGAPYIDTQCGFKGLTADATEVVFSRQRLNGFCFDAELLYIARKHGLRIDEVPVRWINSPDSRVRVVGDSLGMFCDLVRVRLNDARGCYR